MLIQAECYLGHLMNAAEDNADGMTLKYLFICLTLSVYLSVCPMAHDPDLPVIQMGPAPMALAVRRLTNPTGPAPSTKTGRPRVTSALLQEYTATARGSSRAPSSSLTPSGNLGFGRGVQGKEEKKNV